MNSDKELCTIKTPKGLQEIISGRLAALAEPPLASRSVLGVVGEEKNI